MCQWQCTINVLTDSLYNFMFPPLSKNSVWKWTGTELKYNILKPHYEKLCRLVETFVMCLSAHWFQLIFRKQHWWLQPKKNHTSDYKKALWGYFDYFLVNLKKNSNSLRWEHFEIHPQQHLNCDIVGSGKSTKGCIWKIRDL